MTPDPADPGQRVAGTAPNARPPRSQQHPPTPPRRGSDASRLRAENEALRERAIPDGWRLDEVKCLHYDPSENHLTWRLIEDGPPHCVNHRTVRPEATS